MAKTFTAPFVQGYKTATAVATGAAASITGDAPTNTVLLLTAGAEGGLVVGLSAIPRATVTASSLLLYVSSDAGTTKRLVDSALMAAFTVAATTAIAKTSFTGITTDAPIRLAPGDELYVGSQVALASGIVFTATYGDF